MPRYTFVGAVETVLHGLSHDINARLHRKDHGQPAGSTLVARPGDEISTDEPYANANMRPVEAPKKATPAKKAAPKSAPKKAAKEAEQPAPDPNPEPSTTDSPAKGQE